MIQLYSAIGTYAKDDNGYLVLKKDHLAAMKEKDELLIKCARIEIALGENLEEKDKQIDILRALVDSVTDIVETYQTDHIRSVSTAAAEWKRDWLEKAREVLK